MDALAAPMKDYEDALVAACAARNKIGYIVTRNIKDYEQSKVQAILPDDFLKMVETE